MTEQPTNRRVIRTRALLNKALMELTIEKGYDKVTIEDITERANLGRTTFYLHYQSKDDLLVDHHDQVAKEINLGDVSPHALLSPEPQPGIMMMLSQLKDHPAVYAAFTTSKDASLIRRRITSNAAEWLVVGLKKAFPDSEPAVPIDILARHVIQSQMSMMDWWITNPTSYSAEQCARHIQWFRVNTIAAAFNTTINAALNTKFNTKFNTTIAVAPVDRRPG